MPEPHQLSTFTALCHDHEAFQQMNPGPLKDYPFSILGQTFCIKQLSLLGNIKNATQGSGNLVLILDLLCTFQPYDFSNTFPLFESRFKTHFLTCETEGSFLFCFRLRRAVKAPHYLIYPCYRESLSTSSCSGTQVLEQSMSFCPHPCSDPSLLLFSLGQCYSLPPISLTILPHTLPDESF